jgi:hypothetical protein
MIKKYISEKIVIITIYCKTTLKTIQMITKLDGVFNHMLHEFIIPFQFYMKSSNHVVSRKAFG